MMDSAADQTQGQADLMKQLAPDFEAIDAFLSDLPIKAAVLMGLDKADVFDKMQLLRDRYRALIEGKIGPMFQTFGRRYAALETQYSLLAARTRSLSAENARLAELSQSTRQAPESAPDVQATPQDSQNERRMQQLVEENARLNAANERLAADKAELEAARADPQDTQNERRMQQLTEDIAHLNAANEWLVADKIRLEAENSQSGSYTQQLARELEQSKDTNRALTADNVRLEEELKRYRSAAPAARAAATVAVRRRAKSGAPAIRSYGKPEPNGKRAQFLGNMN